MTASAPDITPNAKKNPQPTAQELAHGIFHCPVLISILNEKHEEVRPFLPKELKQTKPINGQRLEDIECTNCEKLVNSQIEQLKEAARINLNAKNPQSRALEKDLYFQGPEPFNGDPTEARILFLSSNPAVSLNDNIAVDATSQLHQDLGPKTSYPQLGSSQEQVFGYFRDRLDKKRYFSNNSFYKTDEVKAELKDRFFYASADNRSKYKLPNKSNFVLTLAKITQWLTRDINLGSILDSQRKDNNTPDPIETLLIKHKAVISEVVHCKSAGEKDGVEKAAKTCGPLWLDPMISIMPKLEVIVVLGDLAQKSFTTAMSSEPKDSAEQVGNQHFYLETELIKLNKKAWVSAKELEAAGEAWAKEGGEELLADEELKKHIEALSKAVFGVEILGTWPSQEFSKTRDKDGSYKLHKLRPRHTEQHDAAVSIPVLFLPHPNARGVSDWDYQVLTELFKKARTLKPSKIQPS